MAAFPRGLHLPLHLTNCTERKLWICYIFHTVFCQFNTKLVIVHMCVNHFISHFSQPFYIIFLPIILPHISVNCFTPYFCQPIYTTFLSTISLFFQPFIHFWHHFCPHYCHSIYTTFLTTLLHHISPNHFTPHFCTSYTSCLLTVTHHITSNLHTPISTNYWYTPHCLQIFIHTDFCHSFTLSFIYSFIHSLIHSLSV